MAAPVTTLEIVVWAESVQLRSRHVQAKAHDSSDLLRKALDRTNKWFRHHGYEQPDLAWQPDGFRTHRDR
jgi:hypothetical protein